MRKFEFGKMLEYVQKYRITALTLVPPIAVALAKRAEVKDFDLSSVESAGCGAAPLGQEAQIVQAVFPNPSLVMQVFLQRVFAQSVGNSHCKIFLVLIPL